MDLGPDFIKGFRAGEEQAFDRVFRAYYAPLAFYANKFVHDEAAAEDIVQDCFVDLWSRRKKLESVESVSAYLYRCVHNKAVRYLERSGKSIPDTNDPLVVASIEEAIVSSEILQHILHVLDHLPARMQQVLRMYYLEERSCAEIGAVIGIDPETVRSHRYRAIMLLRKTIIPG